jgi:hypothetical protein
MLWRISSREQATNGHFEDSVGHFELCRANVCQPAGDQSDNPCQQPAIASPRLNLRAPLAGTSFEGSMIV